jgi:hypothetical protein
VPHRSPMRAAAARPARAECPPQNEPSPTKAGPSQCRLLGSAGAPRARARARRAPPTIWTAVNRQAPRAQRLNRAILSHPTGRQPRGPCLEPQLRQLRGRIGRFGLKSPRASFVRSLIIHEHRSLLSWLSSLLSAVLAALCPPAHDTPQPPRAPLCTPRHRLSRTPGRAERVAQPGTHPPQGRAAPALALGIRGGPAACGRTRTPPPRGGADRTPAETCLARAFHVDAIGKGRTPPGAHHPFRRRRSRMAGQAAASRAPAPAGRGRAAEQGRSKRPARAIGLGDWGWIDGWAVVLASSLATACPTETGCRASEGA